MDRIGRPEQGCAGAMEKERPPSAVAPWIDIPYDALPAARHQEFLSGIVWTIRSPAAQNPCRQGSDCFVLP
jgi:hypothetical protein